MQTDDGIEEVEGRLDALEGQLADLEARVEELEQAARPPVPRPRRRSDPEPLVVR